MKPAQGREFWERVVREVEAGAKRVDVAARHGVSAWSVGRWCQRLRKERPRLLPVRIAEERPRRLELTTGAARIAFEEGTSPAYVAALVRALES